MLTSDLVLAVGAVILEVAIRVHSADMDWSTPILAVRVPVIVAVLVLRRRLPLVAAVLAVAEGQLSLVEYGKFGWVGLRSLGSFGSRYSISFKFNAIVCC